MVKDINSLLENFKTDPNEYVGQDCIHSYFKDLILIDSQNLFNSKQIQAVKVRQEYDDNVNITMMYENFPTGDSQLALEQFI